MEKSDKTTPPTATPKRRLDMETSVLTQVHFVGNRINSTGSAGYRKWFGIGISEFRLLVVIGNEPGSTGARINEIMGLDLGAISRTLRRMETNGLVLSEPHPRHPSYRCWHLTQDGADLHDRISEMTDAREAAILAGFSKAEVFQLLSLLHRLSENSEKLEKIASEGLSEDG
ncbi:MarR family winged helix-turn-helix transcriptional regulator [Pacificoceanicola onchidii]|uniref:MarR family winged helix-turn-helix transcriptional regulator n=1 Tax=Pacificoceanicola onchidii TaxID=2562685 RepID=UPI0010A42A56|nr:MarR family winged helix-turn-helix transcriptional regulator [Pacificoceanicola onchidii]